MYTQLAGGVDWEVDWRSGLGNGLGNGLVESLSFRVQFLFWGGSNGTPNVVFKPDQYCRIVTLYGPLPHAVDYRSQDSTKPRSITICYLIGITEGLIGITELHLQSFSQLHKL